MKMFSCKFQNLISYVFFFIEKKKQTTEEDCMEVMYVAKKATETHSLPHKENHTMVPFHQKAVLYIV